MLLKVMLRPKASIPELLEAVVAGGLLIELSTTMYLGELNKKNTL